MKLTNVDRKDLTGLALQIFMSFAATAGSAITLFFALSLFSWFHTVNAGTAYLVLLVGIPASVVVGAILSWHLYRFYNEEQAHQRSIMESIPYNEALLPDCITRYIPIFMFLVAVFDLLMSMMDYESLFAFWVTGALFTVIFIIGCVVMVNVALTSRRWRAERVPTRGLWLW